MTAIDAVNPEALDLIARLNPEGGANLLERLIATYLDEARRQWMRMREAHAARDPQVLRKAAHALKSSSGSVGAMPLASLCERIERESAHATPEETSALLDAAARESDRVREALLQRLTNGDGVVRI